MKNKDMIAICWSDFMKFGCPNCGCDSARGGHINGGGTTTGTCRECGTSFCLLSDDLKKSAIGFGTNEKDKNGKPVFIYPERQEHPRKGIPWHPWIAPDPRPEEGEFWRSRGIGYDLSGFVKSKPAGERLLEMVKEVLGKEKPNSWLDWREHEPEWIQFKFQKNEFDLEKLHVLTRSNSDIITKEILIECKI